MKRLLAIMAIWVSFLGAVWAVTEIPPPPDSVLARVDKVKIKSSPSIAIHVRTSFSGETNPFALDEEGTKQTLLVRLNGTLVLVERGAFDSTKEHAVADIDAKEGINELFVEAYPPRHEYARSHAMTVRVMSGTKCVVDETIWSTNGEPLTSSVLFELRGRGGP